MLKRKNNMTDVTPSLKRSKRTKVKKVLNLQVETEEQVEVECNRPTSNKRRRPKTLAFQNSTDVKQKNDSPVDGGLSDLELTTPTSNRTTSKLNHASPSCTPLQAKDLMSSHSDEPQPDVVWDCNSPDAIKNILKLNGKPFSKHRGQRLADMVKKLSNTTKEVTDAGPSLLDIWMHKDPTDVVIAEPKPKVTRNTRSKSAHGKKKMSILTDELIKQLTHSVQAEKDKTTDREKSVEPTSQSVMASPVFDRKPSQSSKKEVTQAEVTSSPTHGKDDILGKDSTIKPNALSDDDEWGEDDLFGDESFLLKATQEDFDAEKFKTPKPVKKRLSNSTPTLGKPELKQPRKICVGRTENKDSELKSSNPTWPKMTDKVNTLQSRPSPQIPETFQPGFTSTQTSGQRKSVFTFQSKKPCNISGIGSPLASSSVGQGRSIKTSSSSNTFKYSGQQQNQSSMPLVNNSTMMHIKTPTTSVNNSMASFAAGSKTTVSGTFSPKPFLRSATLKSSTPLAKNKRLLSIEDSPNTSSNWSDCSISDDILIQFAEPEVFGITELPKKSENVTLGASKSTESVRKSAITKVTMPKTSEDGYVKNETKHLKDQPPVQIKRSKPWRCNQPQSKVNGAKLNNNSVITTSGSDVMSQDTVRTKLFKEAREDQQGLQDDGMFTDDDMLSETQMLKLLDNFESELSQKAEKLPKCSPDEIEQKKQLALERRTKKRLENTIPQTTNSKTETLTEPLSGLPSHPHWACDTHTNQKYK